MKSKTEMALELHSKGFNCAQAVSIPFCEELGVDPSVISRAAEGFGGGMGGFSLTCGALSGAVMVAGLKLARSVDNTGEIKGFFGKKIEKTFFGSFYLC